MTVTYTAEVATCEKFGCFIKLLGRWRGSIYKLMWMDVILFLTLYYGINMIYIHLLEDDSKRKFESVVYYCASYSSLIPLSFVLGFYVNLVMTRWWEQYMTIPWPDSIAVFVSAHVHGQDEGGRLMRRTVMRYVCLCLTIVFTMISPGVKKRFPKLKHLVDAGFLLENERQIIETMDKSFPKYPKHWMPIVWAASIITRARKLGRIRDDFAVKTIIDELNTFRGRCGTLMYYDFISIPLVYTQVVTIAVYSFFVCSILAHQWVDSKRDTYEALDFYSPVFITLQFFFYMGWLKVAETLINPFGEDDDDFELNWMIDRNLQVSYLIVDEMHHEHPELIKDQYWDEIYPNDFPYESEVNRDNPPESSTAKYDAKRSLSKAVSATDTNMEDNKTRLTALNQRSQRFTETLERYFYNSEEDATVESEIRPTTTDSTRSIMDVEKFKNITLYTSSDTIDVESQMDIENIWKKSDLEPVTEEIEKVSETLDEEEILNVEEEDKEKIESSSSHEPPDTEGDLFEFLRLERQQQRVQRTKEYLERYFGSDFRNGVQFLIVTENTEEPRDKKVLTYSELLPEDEYIEQTAVNDQEEYNEIMPKAFTLSDENEILTESEKISEMPETTEIQDTDMESELPIENLNVLTPLNLETLVPLLQSEEPNLLSGNLTLQTSDFREVEKTQTIPNEPAITVERLALDVTQLNEPPRASMNLSDYELFWQSKATSPLGSARSISTRSTDDWELLSARSPSTATEYRVDIEEPERKEPDSKPE